MYLPKYLDKGNVSGRCNITRSITSSIWFYGIPETAGLRFIFRNGISRHVMIKRISSVMAASATVITDKVYFVTSSLEGKSRMGMAGWYRW